MKRSFGIFIYSCMAICVFCYVFLLSVFFLSEKYPYSPSVFVNFGEYASFVHVEASMYTFTEHYHLTIPTAICLILFLTTFLVIIVFILVSAIRYIRSRWKASK